MWNKYNEMEELLKEKTEGNKTPPDAEVEVEAENGQLFDEQVARFLKMAENLQWKQILANTDDNDI